MKNKAFIYFLISLIVFIIGLQTTSFAWWGDHSPKVMWIYFAVKFISFVFAILALFNSFKQIKNKQYNAALNWVSLIGVSVDYRLIVIYFLFFIVFYLA
jgi:hypothetical protein